MSSKLLSNDADFAALEAEFADMDMSVLEDEFGEEGLQAFQELEQELASTLELGGELDVMSINMLTDDPQVDLQFLGGFLKNKVKKLLNKLVALVRRHGPRLANCVPTVTAAVVLFKKGKYLAALRKAHTAYKCIKKAL